MEGIAANVASVSFNNPGGGVVTKGKISRWKQADFWHGGISLYQSLMDKYNKKPIKVTGSNLRREKLFCLGAFLLVL